MDLIGDIERAFAGAIYPNRVAVAIAAVAVLAALTVLARRRRLDLAVRRHPGRSIAALTAAAVVVGPIAWVLGSPLLISSTVDEPPPVLASASIEPSAPPPSPRPSGSQRSLTEPSGNATRTPARTPSPSAVLVERTGRFSGADDFHFGRGSARLIETAPGRFTVRLEDFAVRNGPDLYLYLSPSRAGYAKGAIELGRLKADRGNQNYVVPAGTDVSRAVSIVVWCRQFSVLFATASLS